MSDERITGKDVVLMIGGAVAGAIVPGVIGWYTGSFGVVLSFASANPLESFLWTLLFLSLGVLVGLIARGRSAKKELEAKDRELSKLKKTKREHEALFGEFRDLIHDDQRQVVNVWLSEPGGLVPTDDQRKHMGSWKTMKDFLCHDPVSDRLHIVDGVGEMLLENPRHVYDLMAARVADLEAAMSEADENTTGALTEQVRTPSDSRMVYSNRDDPFAALVPAEVPFLLRVYDDAQAHVGTENLLVARSLRGKGAIYRFDAPSSDFIEESDAALTKEWVPIMNKRADELRKMVEG